MDYREKILSLVRLQPVQPTQVAKVLETNSFMASAMLSEMASKGEVKISFLKIGSSPLYYHPEQAEKLQNYVYALNEKEKRAYDLLKEKEVLQDSQLDPLNRVCLRNLKDFAIPLEVTFNNVQEIFWKWYLLEESKTAELVKKALSIKETISSSDASHPHSEIVKSEEKEQEKLVEKSIDQTENFAVIKRIKKKKEQFQSPAKEQKILESTEQNNKEKIENEKQKTLNTDFFFQKLTKYFEQHGIKILEHFIIKKNNEHDFVLQIPSPIGLLHYYCKAKNKKNISDSDLSTAFVQGQLKKLPSIYLSEGELNKKAEKTIQELKGITFTKIL